MPFRLDHWSLPTVCDSTSTTRKVSAQKIWRRLKPGVNSDILNNYKLNTKVKGLQEALADGATALFGEKYGQEVRTVSIGEVDARVFL